MGQLAAADRLGDGGAELTAVTERGEPGGAKNRSVVICGVGPSATPSCAEVRVAANGPFHQDGALLLRLELACDGVLTVAGWQHQGATTYVHGRGPLAFP